MLDELKNKVILIENKSEKLKLLSVLTSVMEWFEDSN